ncbi:MAG TPA: DUF3108 domain-containing protein [Caldimonas sp.]|jgi:hypothetical protein|nr:DUF3108 domain-containing protein [Caldimonas sp.]HEX2542316.1 DUF3108 domain-containing protein [Caldimonas sp.]
MVGRLTSLRRWPWSGRRRAAFAVLVAAVALLHGVVTRDLARRLAAAEADARRPMPARIEVAYVRTLEPEAPKVAAPAPAPAPTRPRVATARRAAKPVAKAASAVAEAEALAKARAAEPEASAPAPGPAPATVAAAVAAASQGDAAGLAASAPESPELLADAAAAAAAALTAAASSASSAASSAAADSVVTAASAPGGATFTWPTATRVSYLLTGYWRGDLTGRAEVEWIRVGSRYQVHVDLFAGPEFAPLFSRRMSSEGNLGDTGLAPDRYDEDTQVVTRDRRRASVVFAGDEIVLANGQKRERLRGVQDAASQFIQFTWLFGTQPERLRAGNSFDVPLALPRSMSLWTYDVQAEQTLHTPFGPLATYHLKPRRATRKPGDWMVDMWFAPELRYLPVRIRIEQETGSFVELVIAKKPEIAAS